MDIPFRNALSDAFKRNLILEPTELQAEQFETLATELLKINEQMNLTAVRDVAGVIDKHFADSLLAVNEFPQGATVLDVGCGGGFPTLPLAIARPDLQITAMDSTAKKIAFVKDVSEKIGLKNVKTIVGRAEDRNLLAKLGKFDVVTARAVSALNVLSELCMPYVKNGGLFLAMKGAKGKEELQAARKGIEILGAKEIKLILRTLTLADGSEEERTFILAKKASETPPQYPRAYAQIIKKPL